MVTCHNRSSKIAGIACVCLLFGLFVQRVLGQPREARPQLASDAEVERFISWLPSDTEALFVARGPIRVESATGTPHDKSGWAVDLQAFTFGDIFATVLEVPLDPEGDPLQPLQGQEVYLAVYGSRNFRAPNSLGSMPNEGCQIIWLGGDASAANDLENKVAARAPRIMKIGEHRAYVFRTKLEDDDWTFYIVRPKPNLFLAATHKGYLEEVLDRMDQPQLPARAFLPNLPEWKHVNRESQYWGIRHFDRKGAAKDPSSPFGGKKAANEPDEDAIGVAFSYSPTDGNEARVRYLSRNTKAVDIAREMWFDPEQGLSPRFHRIEPDAVEIVVTVDDVNGHYMFMFVLLAVFGHGIYV